MHASPTARDEDIDFVAFLSPIARRNHFGHSAVHLNVEWRDLPDANWSHQIVTSQGLTMPAIAGWAAGRGTVTGAPPTPAWI